MDHLLLLFGAGLMAGGMNALAGGGSFVSLPALIASGVPSVPANASSTVALLPGGAAGAWTYRAGLSSKSGQSLGVGPASLRALIITTLAGGLAGALLLLWTPTTTFDVLLPWLLLLATLALTFGRAVGEWLRRRWRIGPAAMLCVQFGLGVYGGYFGGAVGIMMLAVWGLLDSRDLKSLNAPRTLLVTAANAAAVVIFIAARAVYWRETLLMLAGATLGGFGGAQLGRRLPVRVIRAGTLLITGCITVAFFVRAYGKPMP